MDFPYRIWTPIKRRFPWQIEVAATNFLRDKKYWMRRASPRFSVAVLFRGSGAAYENGKKTAIHAPCALVRNQGTYCEYGPVGEGETWDEFYMNFEKSQLPRMRERGLAFGETQIWPLHNAPTLLRLVGEIGELSKVSPLELVVDRVDRVCERILLEILLGRETELPGEHSVLQIAQKMKDFPEHEFRLSEAARLAGMSVATFRRRWTAQIGSTPRQYLEELRIQEAARLLAETDQPVGEVARTVGFTDELYFSRRFRKATGSSPKCYRVEHLM